MYIDLQLEIGKVERELIFFSCKCVPALLAGLTRDFDTLPEHIRNCTMTVPAWQRAAGQLAELLPCPSRNLSNRNRDDFRAFLFQETKPSFLIQNDQIVWRISLFVDLWLCFVYCPLFCRDRAEAPGALDEFLTRLPEVRRWILGLPTCSSELFNALCMVLPFVADADPDFAKRALTPETWHNIVFANRDLTEADRARQLEWVHGSWFAGVLNNAILHVLGALANNHFLLIEGYLDHPHLDGRYTHLMPDYLFAVLFEKVAILRQLAQGQLC
jgi:hypothetical protein